MKKFVLSILAALLVSAAPLLAQTAAELLQKGIYTQETLGDIDGAIKIYRQLLATAGDARVYAAQAQYRLGLCLLRKGDRAEAERAFARLIEEYPEQKELIAKAKEYLPSALKLLEAPWSDGETLELQMKMASGDKIGTMVYSVESGNANGTPVWNFKTASYPISTPPYLSRVQAERQTMRPIQSFWRLSVMGEARATYQEKSIQLETRGKEPRTISLDGPVYDNEECAQLMRRLPLAPGYKTSFEVFSSLAAAHTKLELEVTALEEIQTPAGKFRAYKVLLQPVNQTYWIGADANRYLLKFDYNVMTAELVAARRPDPAPVEYQDPVLGFQLTAAPGWLFKKYDALGMEKSVTLMDPEAAGFIQVRADQAPADAAAPEAAMRQEAEKKIQQMLKAAKDYKVREDGWRTWQIGGRPALSMVADYTLMGRAWVEYVTWVRGGSLNLRFFVQAYAEDFSALQSRLNPIIESLRLK